MAPSNLPPIEHLARLARLEIEPEQAKRLAAQLERILAHFESLQAIDTQGVEASPYAVSMANVMRQDGPTSGAVDLPRGVKLVREHAPEHEGDQYRVPPILEG